MWTAATALMVCWGWSGYLVAPSWSGTDEHEARAQRMPICRMKEGRSKQLISELMNAWLKGGEGQGGTVALEKFIRAFHFIGTQLFKVCR